MISEDDALRAEQEYLQNQEKIADIQAQLKELEVKETQQEKDYRENLTTISDLQAQLKALDSKQASVQLWLYPLLWAMAIACLLQGSLTLLQLRYLRRLKIKLVGLNRR